MERTESICVEAGRKVCINCAWYRQYYRQGDGIAWTMQPTGTGYCVKHNSQRGALRQHCRDFIQKKKTAQ